MALSASFILHQGSYRITSLPPLSASFSVNNSDTVNRSFNNSTGSHSRYPQFSNWILSFFFSQRPPAAAITEQLRHANNTDISGLQPVNPQQPISHNSILLAHSLESEQSAVKSGVKPAECALDGSVILDYLSGSGDVMIQNGANFSDQSMNVSLQYLQHDLDQPINYTVPEKLPSKRASPKRAVFTPQKARELRKKLKETYTFHDVMYHSAIASRLATLDN